ncbi:MAG: ArsJ-associated glyceraldehyde-3-phosphate dehydrogenase [Gammaproteobacteria bacterium]|nr:ArsJ-associated glyceraldehyde-3-phosphate dehydrogenase [Gammaproteobacteria bacterium]
MSIKVAINGFGRMGRLALRAAWAWPDFEIVHINEKSGNEQTAAHLLKFDSVHGTWAHEVYADQSNIIIDGQSISYSQNTDIHATPWNEMDIDIVVECTGVFKTAELLQPYFQQGIKKVVVSAPIYDDSKDAPLNIVMGVNDNLYQPEQHNIITAASCTTNCIAPVVKVIHEQFGIKHGSITTLHNITNTQSIIDQYHKDLRRARSSGQSMIPTTTGSATAITDIFPELKGKLNGVAVRIPLTNASLTDCVFEVNKTVTIDEVNTALKRASEETLSGILGYEERPLVSCDYTNDIRSTIIDALSTMVINGTQVKILTWYDNEIGYVNRMMELVKKVTHSL